MCSRAMGTHNNIRDRRVCLAVSRREFEMLQYAQTLLRKEKGREIPMNMVFLILANRYIKSKEHGDEGDVDSIEGLQDMRAGLIAVRNELDGMISRLRCEDGFGGQESGVPVPVEGGHRDDRFARQGEGYDEECCGVESDKGCVEGES